MSISFACPVCRSTISGSDFLVGRRVRCPECDGMVEVPESAGGPSAGAGSGAPQRRAAGHDESTGTVYLSPQDSPAGDTVMLEAIDVIEPQAPAATALRTGTAPAGALATGDGTPVAPPPVKAPPAAAGTAEGEPAPQPIISKRKTEETEMDMTPMVDVTFLLLIFFMVTAAFTLQKSLEIPKPADEDPSTNVQQQDPDEQKDFVTVRVDEYNAYHVTTVDWEEEAPSVQDLHIFLRRARDGDSTGTVPKKLRVEAHGESLHERVVAALDAGTATGFEEVQLTTIEDE